jgi:hypothetical protein
MLYYLNSLRAELLRYARKFDLLVLLSERSANMQQEYIIEIIELLQKCEDISLLDLILQLLQKG